MENVKLFLRALRLMTFDIGIIDCSVFIGRFGSGFVTMLRFFMTNPLRKRIEGHLSCLWFRKFDMKNLLENSFGISDK